MSAAENQFFKELYIWAKNHFKGMTMFYISKENVTHHGKSVIQIPVPFLEKDLIIVSFLMDKLFIKNFFSHNTYDKHI